MGNRTGSGPHSEEGVPLPVPLAAHPEQHRFQSLNLQENSALCSIYYSGLSLIHNIFVVLDYSVIWTGL